jgi:hypothetical protein
VGSAFLHETGDPLWRDWPTKSDSRVASQAPLTGHVASHRLVGGSRDLPRPTREIYLLGTNPRCKLGRSELDASRPPWVTTLKSP